ncbi:YceD family protein [Ottowia thiooxydans]|uniref:Large ribosomal RNA subunit accumulation protein YceD n=1 Tax=Ottowia thiooxydans TaxID=219182 RepID=A0ABV2Q671_9BURK
MSRIFNARRLDVAAFSQAKAQLSGHDPVQNYERLSNELHGPAPGVLIDWQAEGGQRRAVDGGTYVALHLNAGADLPLTCQLCMGEIIEPVTVDRHFLFLADEDAAASLDESSEEDDVLALSSEFDLQALIEDEMLMALPLVPRHEQCPEAPTLASDDADFEAALKDKAKPFASLASLKGSLKSK